MFVARFLLRGLKRLGEGTGVVNANGGRVDGDRIVDCMVTEKNLELCDFVMRDAIYFDWWIMVP